MSVHLILSFYQKQDKLKSSFNFAKLEEHVWMKKKKALKMYPCLDNK